MKCKIFIKIEKTNKNFGLEQKNFSAARSPALAVAPALKFCCEKPKIAQEFPYCRRRFEMIMYKIQMKHCVSIQGLSVGR